MAVPKRRVSSTKGKQRRASAWKLAAPTLVKCPSCGKYKMPHKVCPACGNYNGKKVIDKD